MATAEDLAQLKTLLNQLLPIAQTRPGELIRAEDWNTLVGAVMGLARTLLEQEQASEVPAHTHLDQVTADWLVPALRDQLQRGPLADPAMQTRLLRIEQQLRALLIRADVQRDDLTGVRGRLAEIATRDIVRESAVTDVTRKVSGFGDARGEVLDLRKSLGSVQTDLGTVLEAARSLQVDGTTVNVGAMVDRLSTLENFRQSFTAANGQLLDAPAIEQRMAENRNQFVSQGQLDTALQTRTGVISPDVLAGLEDRIGSTLRTQTNSSFQTLAAQIRADTQTSLNGVSDLVTSRLNDAVPGVTQSVTNTLTVTINKASQDAIAAAVKQASDITTARETAIRADLAGQATDLRASFLATVKEQIGQELPVALSGVRADMSALSAKADVLGTRTANAEVAIGKQGEAVAALQQDGGRLRLELRDQLQNEIKLAASTLTADLNTKSATFQTNLKSQFDALAKDVRQKALDQATLAAVEAAQTETRNARAQILAEMRQVAREEAGSLVRDQLTLNPGRPVLNIPINR